jgi:hypothetical protein
LYGAGTANNYLGGNLTINRSQNASTSLTIENATTGTAANSSMVLRSDNAINVANLFKNSSTATTYKIALANDSILYNASNQSASDIGFLNDTTLGKIKFAAGASSTAQMTLTAAGRLLLGLTAESTFLLDVNGTARVSDNLTVSRNQNATTQIEISNTNTSSSSASSLKTTSSNGSTQFGKQSSSANYKILSNNNAYIYNDNTSGDIAILNDFATGSIKFASGGSSTAQATITAAGRFLLGTATESTFIFDTVGTARVSGFMTMTGSITASSGVSRGAIISSTLVASANSDVLVGLDINPTFTNGVYTGVSNIPLRIGGTSVTSSGGFGGTSARVRTLISDTTSGGYTQLAIQGPSNGGAAMQIYDGSGVAVADFGMNTAGKDFALINRMTSGIMQFYTHNGTSLATRLYISATGNILVNSTTENASAILQADSTTKGFLPPRMTTTQKNAIGTPAAGLQVYDSTLNQMSYYNGTTWINF